MYEKGFLIRPAEGFLDPEEDTEAISWCVKDQGRRIGILTGFTEFQAREVLRTLVNAAQNAQDDAERHLVAKFGQIRSE